MRVGGHAIFLIDNLGEHKFELCRVEFGYLYNIGFLPIPIDE